jgi:hypothetical protein
VTKRKLVTRAWAGEEGATMARFRIGLGPDPRGAHVVRIEIWEVDR